MLAPYTDNDTVRATVGVTDDELPDAVLDLDLYQMVLTLELDGIGTPPNDGTLSAAFATVDVKPAATRTALERRLHDAVLLFSPYPVVLHLETAIPLFAIKQATDGKAGMTRHSDSPFKDIFKTARDNFDRFKANLERAWAKYNSTTALAKSPPVLFAASRPSTDPVTG